MSDAAPQELGVLAKLVMVLGIVLIVAGVVWHGVTGEALRQFWHDLVERPDGPMRFRFFLQPLMAAIAAIHDGREDARAGRSPYFMAVLQSAGAPWTAARGIKQDRQNHPSGDGDGRRLSASRVQDVLSRSGARRRAAARICPVLVHPRTGFTSRAVAHP
jgi:hypothetical protein